MILLDLEIAYCYLPYFHVLCNILMSFSEAIKSSSKLVKQITDRDGVSMDLFLSLAKSWGYIY